MASLAPAASRRARPVMGTNRVGLSSRLTQFTVFLDDQVDALGKPIAQGDHHATPILELVDQRLRNLLRSACDDNRIERRGIRPALVAVANSSVDVGISQLFVNLGRAFGKRRVDLDRIDFLDQAQTGSPTDSPIRCPPRRPMSVGLGFEHLGHERHVVRRGDRLTFTDRNRLVVISLPPGAGREKAVSGDSSKRVKDSRILDASLCQMSVDHSVAGGRERVVARRSRLAFRLFLALRFLLGIYPKIWAGHQGCHQNQSQSYTGHGSVPQCVVDRPRRAR